MASLAAPQDTPEDQVYICSEFQRANALMLKLSEKQQILSIRKLELEKGIMAKAGVNDGDLWKELKDVRAQIDALAQEKLILIAKLYNLAQKFVQELDVATEETSRQMQLSTQNGRGAGANYNELMTMTMRETNTTASAKSFDESMLEPVDNSTGQYGKDVMGVVAGASHRKSRAGQHRAQDGKFESSFAAAGRKGSYFGESTLTKVESQGGGGRKTGSRKRAGGGGDVGRAFYDQGLPGAGSQEPLMHQNSIGGKFSESLDGTPRADADEENKAMYEGHEGLMGSIGLTDNAINADEALCKKCSKQSPPNELPTPTNETVEWLLCERCQSWFHAVCVQDKLIKMGITCISAEALEDVDFQCCDE